MTSCSMEVKYVTSGENTIYSLVLTKSSETKLYIILLKLAQLGKSQLSGI